MEPLRLETRELLLQNLSWMRALARELVRDAHAAEDLVQDAAAVSLEAGPADAGAWRGWLRTVLRRRAGELLRSSHARAAREREVGCRAPAPAVVEGVARVELQRELAECVLALDEPYRTTLVLRFYRGLAPREIAREQRVPVATVKSRLARGLAELRRRLDSRCEGGRDAWVSALAPWAGKATSTSVLVAGGLVKSKLAWTVAVLAVLGLWWILQRAPAETGSASAGEPRGSRVARSTSIRDADAGSAARDPRSVPEPRSPRAATDRDPPAEVASTAIAGLALDGGGAPVAGLLVRLAATGESARCDARGRFELRTNALRSRIESADPAWIDVRAAEWQRGTALDALLVVAPAIELEGRVVDEQGLGLEGALVALVPPADLALRVGRVLDASTRERWSTRSDAQGAFALHAAPALVSAQLRASDATREPAFATAPRVSTAGIVLVLRGVPDRGAGTLRGRVLRADGSFADRACVSLGSVTVPTDLRGEFTLALERALDTRELVAVEAGSLPARRVRPEAPSPAASGWPAFVELVLGAPALSVRGRVRDESGVACPGMRVWILDPTRLGFVGTVPIQLEALAAGAALPAEALESRAQPLASGGEPLFSSACPAKTPDALFSWVVTDDAGVFEIGGLDEREYHLAALDPELGRGARSGPIAAGARNVELVVPESASFERVAGRVRTRAGEPVANVRIVPFVTAFQLEERIFGGRVDVTRYFLARATTTDARGRFEFGRIARAEVAFELSAEDILPAYASVEGVRDPLAFDIQVDGRVHLEIELAPRNEPPDSFRVLDALGAGVDVYELSADGYSNYAEYTLRDGRSGIVSTTTRAARIEFLSRGKVVDSVPVHAKLGETLFVRR